jgi:polysaccharide export outer membrane protein
VSNDNTVSGTYRIGPYGRLSLPLIHDFSAAGLTIPQLQLLITQKLEPYIADAIVNVQLLRNNSEKYRLEGGVLKPGPYPLLKNTTILDALKAAGGLDPLAAADKITLLRGPKAVSPGSTNAPISRLPTTMTFSQLFHFNYSETINGIRPEQNITLQDGDILFVPLQ